MKLYERIISFLREQKVDYVLLEHLPVWTSEQAAAVRRDVSLHQGAKAMVLKVLSSKFKDQSGQTPTNNQELITNDFIMAVLPGDRKIDFKKLKILLGVHDVALAKPFEVERLIGVKIGAVSPFGNLADLRVYLDESILDNEEIVFNAGDHAKSVKLRLVDYRRLVRPVVASFSKVRTG